MNHGEFIKLIDNRWLHCFQLLGSKNAEYAEADDKLSNFKQAAALKGETPERALWGMLAKHIISIKKIIYDLDQGKIPLPVTVSEKCSDMINYTLLLEALIQERNPAKVAGFKNCKFDNTRLATGQL